MSPEQKKVHQRLSKTLPVREHLGVGLKPVHSFTGDKEWSMAMLAKKMAKKGIPKL